ncbi:MAG TPA: phage tail protein [Gallionellaceae bacterium]|nr:phage tail protein [Gallionellaceae bacterium]
MSTFTTPANLRMLDNFKWELLTPFQYHIGNLPSDDVIEVPAGFVTDLASTPRLLWTILPPHGQYAKAAILHDYLYDNATGSKRYADDVYLEAMEVLGVATWRRRVMYWAVRWFGKGNYSS